jgi:ABC-type branched-subunit amino acid transport system permease subunit
VTYIIVLLVLLAIIALYIRNQKSRTGTQTEAIGSGPIHVRAAISYDPKAIQTMIGIPS